MTRSDREYLAKRIVPHYTTMADRKKGVTINHFIAENVRRQTICTMIHKYDTSNFVGENPGVVARENSLPVNEHVSKDWWTITLAFRCEK